MGLVADGGPTSVQTFTGWYLKDSGIGNQWNAITGVDLHLRQLPDRAELPVAEADRRAGAERRAGAGPAAQHPRRSVRRARQPRDDWRANCC